MKAWLANMFIFQENAVLQNILLYSKCTTAATFVTLCAMYRKMPHDLQSLIPFSLLGFPLVLV